SPTDRKATDRGARVSGPRGLLASAGRRAVQRRPVVGVAEALRRKAADPLLVRIDLIHRSTLALRDEEVAVGQSLNVAQSRRASHLRILPIQRRRSTIDGVVQHPRGAALKRAIREYQQLVVGVKVVSVLYAPLGSRILGRDRIGLAGARRLTNRLKHRAISADLHDGVLFTV